MEYHRLNLLTFPLHRVNHSWCTYVIPFNENESIHPRFYRIEILWIYHFHPSQFRINNLILFSLIKCAKKLHFCHFFFKVRQFPCFLFVKLVSSNPTNSKLSTNSRMIENEYSSSTYLDHNITCCSVEQLRPIYHQIH